MLIDKIEIERIKQANPLLGYLQAMGFKLKRKGKQYFIHCPFHSDTNESFAVDPYKQLWNCFSCNEGGDIYKLVMKLENVDFRQAHLLLGGELSDHSSNTNEESSQDNIIINTQVNQPETQINEINEINEIAQIKALASYSNYYHQILVHTPKAIDYLQSRGINLLAIKTFKIGYVDGSIVDKLSSSDKEALTQLGLFTSTGKEFWQGYIIFPLIDGQTNQVVSIYGRSTESNQHLYLKGKRRGIVNPIGAKNTTDLIIVESVIDALALWSLGLTNVTGIYGTQGLIDELIDHLKECRVKELILMLDNDSPGRNATTKIAKRLQSSGFQVRSVTLPTKDPSDFVVNGGTLEQLQQLIYSNKQVQIPINKATQSITQPTIEATKEEQLNSLQLKKNNDDSTLIFTKADREYRVKGLSIAEMSRLKVNIRLQVKDSYHIDTLDLFSAKARERFAQSAEKRHCAKANIIESELSDLIDLLDAIRLQMRKGESSTKQPTPMSIEERTKALEYLSSPNLIEKIVEDASKQGLISERANILTAYLSAISRKLAKPLSILVVARSGAGKSSLQESICAFVPPEDVIWVTRLTGQALFYKDPNSLKGKVLAIAEEEGAAQAIYSLRTLASDQRLSIAVTQTNPQTGELHTKHYDIHGPVSIITTTTSPEAFDEETRSRFVLLTMNESTEQTQAILVRQRQRRTLEGVLADAQSEQLRQLHHNIQRLIRPLKVVNPYVEQLSYPAEHLIARREQGKYLTLIDSIALLHQYQREVKEAYSGAIQVDYVEVHPSDIALANELAQSVLWRSFDEMAPPARGCLEAIKELYQKRANEMATELENVALSRREIRQAIGWTDWQVRVYCQKLVDLEYLYLINNGNGRATLYKLVEPVEAALPNFKGLTEVKQLDQRYLHRATKTARFSS